MTPLGGNCTAYGPTKCKFTEALVDASGTGQVLADALGISQANPAALKVRSRALYSHFTGVGLWQDLLEEDFGPAATANHPYRCDDATLHQIIDGGWMWIIRFDNAITSAGFSLDPDKHPLRSDETAEEEWHRLLHTYPSLARQFSHSEPTRPFVRTGRLQRRLSQPAGSDWAMLPHTAGFLDAWLSPGIAQTLFAVNRLGRILAEERTGRGPERRLLEYNVTVLRELAWVDEITGTCFACFDRFHDPRYSFDALLRRGNLLRRTRTPRRSWPERCVPARLALGVSRHRSPHLPASRAGFRE